jgi:hypothetical protein
MDLAAVSLSAISCVALIILTLPLLGEGVEASSQVGKIWKVRARTLIGIYLFIAAVLVTGAMAWSGAQSLIIIPNGSSDPRAEASLFVARCTMWAVSVFCQGLTCGLILLSLTERDNPPSSFSWQANSQKASAKWWGWIRWPAPAAELQAFEALLRTHPCQRDSKQGSLVSHGHGSENRKEPRVSQENRDTDDHLDCGIPQTIRGVQSEITRPLDSLILPGSASSPPSTAHSERSRAFFQLHNTSWEHNVHPLFRSDSPTPPPTPSLGSVITVAPAAGQTISFETLNKMRSCHSPPANRRRTNSALSSDAGTFPEVEHQSSNPGTEKTAMFLPNCRYSEHPLAIREERPSHEG